jgi:hypothetical protein
VLGRIHVRDNRRVVSETLWCHTGCVATGAELSAEAPIAVDGSHILITRRQPARLTEGKLHTRRSFRLQVPVEVVDHEIVAPNNWISDLDCVGHVSRSFARPS